MKRLRECIICAAAFAVLLLLPVRVSAAEIDTAQLAEDYGADGMTDMVPYDARDFLRENGISPSDPGSVTALSPKTVISYMGEKLKNSAAAPLRLAGMIISAVILAAAAGAAADTAGGGECTRMYRIVTVLAAVTVTVPSVERCVDTAAQTLSAGSDFMLCYVPVFAGISAAAGSAASSASYNAVVLIIAETAVKIASELIMPVISVCMAMSIIDAINPSFSLSSVTGLMKKAVSLFLGFVMTVFTGLLSIQSIVGVSADTVGVKAAKFMVSNLVPVVGGAVADAYATMRAGLGLLRGAAGAFGIIAAAAILLPPLLETLCMYLAVTAGEAAADIFGIKELSTFFKGTASALSLITAVLACFGVMFVISTIILMAAGLGTSNV